MTVGQSLRGRTLLGDFFYAPNATTLTALRGALLAIDSKGNISEVVKAEDERFDRRRSEAERSGVLVRLSGMVFPGFVDLHVHAPQYPQLGKALDEPLEVWLQKWTFPLEARYADLKYAARSYRALVGDLLRSGTTTAQYFGTIHEAATRLLIDVCVEKGQRAFVGKVAMDNVDQCPDFYRDASAESSLAGTREVLEYARSIGDSSRVQAVITPRFVPACSDTLLEGLGNLAKQTGAPIQTHCSESDWQHIYARVRFGKSDAEVLHSMGLMTSRTTLAHGNFLSESDMDLVRDQDASIAHCPYSNIYLSTAVFPLRTALAKGLKVGLGTDIAGGASRSMLDTIRMTMAASRMLENGVDPQVAANHRGRPDSRVSILLAFHLATAGGGDALNLPVGRFEVGQAFDAVLVDPEEPTGTIRLWDETDDEQILQTVLLTASQSNIHAVWTSGLRARSAEQAPLEPYPSLAISA